MTYFDNTTILNGRATCHYCEKPIDVDSGLFFRVGAHELVFDHAKPPKDDTSFEDRTVGFYVFHRDCSPEFRVK